MQRIILFLFINLLLFSSCFNNNRNTSVSFKENENKFEMNAVYNPSRTKRIENYIQNKMKITTEFKNEENNPNATLFQDKNAKFFVQSVKGKLNISFNKNENSEQSYYTAKQMCEELKEIIIQ